MSTRTGWCSLCGKIKDLEQPRFIEERPHGDGVAYFIGNLLLTKQQLETHRATGEPLLYRQKLAACTS
jgi:hypothetical protein